MGTKMIFLKFLCLFSVIGAKCREKPLNNGQYWDTPKHRKVLEGVDTYIESGRPPPAGAKKMKSYNVYSDYGDPDLYDLFSQNGILIPSPLSTSFNEQLSHRKTNSKLRRKKDGRLKEKYSRTAPRKPSFRDMSNQKQETQEVPKVPILAPSTARQDYVQNWDGQKNPLTKVEIVLETFDAGPALLTKTVYKNCPDHNRPPRPDPDECQTCTPSQDDRTTAGATTTPTPTTTESRIVTTQREQNPTDTPVTTINRFEDDKTNKDTSIEDYHRDVENVDASPNVFESYVEDNNNRNMEDFFLNFLYGMNLSGKPQYMSKNVKEIPNARR